MYLTGKIKSLFSGRIAAHFINKSNSELTRKNYLSNLRQFILFSGKKDVTDVNVEMQRLNLPLKKSRFTRAKDKTSASEKGAPNINRNWQERRLRA